MSVMFGETLRKLREERGLSQKELGKQMFVNHSTIARWEADPSVITGQVLRQLSDLFGCTTDYLLGRSEERVPPARMVG